MKVILTDDALRDRQVHYLNLRERNPSAARSADAAIRRDIAILKRHPHIGRPAAGNTRESVVQRTPFIIGYEIRGDVIYILRIWHHAQDRPMPD